MTAKRKPTPPPLPLTLKQIDILRRLARETESVYADEVRTTNAEMMRLWWRDLVTIDSGRAGEFDRQRWTISEKGREELEKQG